MRPAGDILIVCRFYGLACRDGLFHNRIIARERRRPTRAVMKIDDVRRTAYSMPLTNPSFPPGPYRFFNREFFVVAYRTDPEALAAVVPEPLEVAEPVVKYEFIRMPDSTGFGDYTETGQVIPVRFKGEAGAYVHSMYLDDEGPIAGGRELWGFPKKLASPKIAVESDVLVGTLHYGSVLCASATMGYKHRQLDHDTVLESMKAPSFMIKIIPHVDGTPRICELVRYYLEDITLKEAWAGPAALGLFPHALCDVARLPVREVVSAVHFKADLTLGLGTVAFDYMAK
jgi:acetoacetate decarboxylase